MFVLIVSVPTLLPYLACRHVSRLHPCVLSKYVAGAAVVYAGYK